MSEVEFSAYLEHAVEDYAQAHLKAGDCVADEALTLARADYERLLPKGLATEGQHLCTIHADGETGAVGMLWFASRGRLGGGSAYIYDFQVRPELRGRGYGSAALKELERMLVRLQVRRVGLNVMGWNAAARALYERHGFAVATLQMIKDLAQPENAVITEVESRPEVP